MGQINKLLDQAKAASHNPNQFGYELSTCNGAVTDQQKQAEIFAACCKAICGNFTVDAYNRSLLNEIFKYANGKSTVFDSKRGLWLYGTIGTGKTSLIKILREYDAKVKGRTPNGYLIGGYGIYSASTVVNQFSRLGLDGIDLYCFKKQTCAFDEIGREPLPAKYYGTEMNVMQYVFQMRYDMRNDCLTHVTTNLTPDQIGSVYGDYIADRVNEMFNVIELKGLSRR